MNVAARVQYPGANMSPTTKQLQQQQQQQQGRPYQQQSAPRDYDFDDRALNYTKTPHFDSHDDFYAFLESNRSGINLAANPATAGMPPQQAHVRPQQQQQRSNGMPPNQYPDQQRASMSSGRPRAPSYTGSGSQSEEMLVAKSEAAKKAQRHPNGRRPTTKPPSSSSGAPTSGTSPKRRPESSGSATGGSAPNSGEAIQRLKTPSLMDSVLHPLDQKVREYGELMRREQDQIERLDEELRILAERRAEAEARFLEAKGKHDDFQRRHEDVGRAMRGEPPLTREPLPPMPPAPLMNGAAGGPPGGLGIGGPGAPPPAGAVPPPLRNERFPRPASFHPDHDDLDDLSESSDDERHHPPTDRRVQSQHSFGRPPAQQKKGRFRMSLFGS